MDWSRAKSALIFSFLLLNLLLGYQLWSEVRTEVNANANTAELPADKLQLMQQKKITLSTNLPSETPRMGDLTYLLQSDSMENRKAALIIPPVDSSVVFTSKQLTRSLGDLIADLDEYSYDVHSSRDGVFVLQRMVDGRPMFQTKLELYNSNLKITAFLQDRVEITGTGEAQQVLSASKIVSSLIESYLENGSVIVDIQLGYYGQIFDSEVQVATPAWRVMLDDSKVYYVDAISGEVLTDNTEDKL
ncbi:two-component system regulatory protein YycI [Paenibacillus endoradicis]|uniref:two-component system regulatory protein YycI n=1 Tax=Paenibacillus endoradicis TaxID=2972487 RepID=UPI0021598C6B|nr:two-component system regulatory protein YycI [Paenibacillus endoradicis]MCR8658518.1 two-component system regulatory protein YycI [Paenibacillus endoradicis]